MPTEQLDLDALRRLSAGSGGADIQDPHFHEVSGLNFKDGDKRRKQDGPTSSTTGVAAPSTQPLRSVDT